MSLFFFNDTATTEIYTLSLHDALPILPVHPAPLHLFRGLHRVPGPLRLLDQLPPLGGRLADEDLRRAGERSEEHTSELQSRQYLVCRLLLEKKKHIHTYSYTPANVTNY